MKYKVPARYTFEVEWEVEAESKDEARRIVENDCGCFNPTVNSSVSETNWNTNPHATKTEIFKPKFVEKEDKE